jgi:hypothetical protein
LQLTDLAKAIMRPLWAEVMTGCCWLPHARRALRCVTLVLRAAYVLQMTTLTRDERRAIVRGSCHQVLAQLTANGGTVPEPVVRAWVVKALQDQAVAHRGCLPAAAEALFKATDGLHVEE